MMRKLLVILSLLLLTACSVAPLRDTHVVERYGEPDDIIIVGPVTPDARTGIYHDALLIYDLPLSANPLAPDQRVVFLVDGTVTGMAIFRADGSVTIEDFPQESTAVYYKKMFFDWVWI